VIDKCLYCGVEDDDVLIGVCRVCANSGSLERLSELGHAAGWRLGERWDGGYEAALDFCLTPSHSFGPTYYAARLDGYRLAGVSPEDESAIQIWHSAYEDGFLCAARMYGEKS
jgi:hypothetical protein